MLKNNGISVLISCQDDALTLAECVESFLSFGDELIIISNRATDDTLELAKSLEKQYYPKVRHIDVPEAFDLYQNRQAGLNCAKYRWVMRCDADYIAYEDCDGIHSITQLRKRILKILPLWPVAIHISKVCLSLGWKHMYDPNGKEDAILKYIPKVYTGKKEPRIYMQNPFLRFIRLGRWEGVPYIKWYRRINIDSIYWFEVTLRSPRALLLRQARTDWREFGDFNKYPELINYVMDVFLPNKYPGLSIIEAESKYVNEEVLPHIIPYDEGKYFKLPLRINMKNSKN